jgi:hypothetical protein
MSDFLRGIGSRINCGVTPANRRVVITIGVLLAVALLLFFFLPKKYTVSRLFTSLKGSMIGQAVPVRESAKPESEPAVSQPVSMAGAAVHPVTKAVVNAGLLAPASRLNQIANFLTAGTESGAVLFLDPGQTDRDVLSSSFEAVRSDQTSLYASASFAPSARGYDAVYDTVEYGTVPCPEVERRVFSNLKKAGILKKNITMLDGGSVKVFLMTAGPGCVVIKKEVVR